MGRDAGLLLFVIQDALLLLAPSWAGHEEARRNMNTVSNLEMILQDVDRLRRAFIAQREAIEYVLARIQMDPDVYHLLGWGTEAFRQLCLAEEAATGKPFKRVEEERRHTAFAFKRRYLSAIEWEARQDKSVQDQLVEHVRKARANFDMPEPCCPEPQIFTTAATTHGQLMGPAKICRACGAWRFVFNVDWTPAELPEGTTFPEGVGFLIPEPYADRRM